jgi:hypothetical protein
MYASYSYYVCKPNSAYIFPLDSGFVHHKRISYKQDHVQCSMCILGLLAYNLLSCLLKISVVNPDLEPPIINHDSDPDLDPGSI